MDLNIVNDSEIRFFTPRFYALDSFAAYSIELWGKKFPTAEHAYQWKKYSESNPALAEQIFQAENPNAVKKLSDVHKQEVSETFTAQKVAVMEEIVRAKANQHEKIRALLAESGNKVIIENSPDDAFWGAGPHNDGQNMLGKIWMKIRDELK